MWPLRPRRRPNSGDLGRYGEKLATKALKRDGMKILARNYRCPAGEVDIIALDRSTRRKNGAETIVFVEVKTRFSDKYVDPEFAVDRDKQRRLENIAQYYASKRNTEDYCIRFDIIAIVAGDSSNEKPAMKHIKDAF